MIHSRAGVAHREHHAAARRAAARALGRTSLRGVGLDVRRLDPKLATVRHGVPGVGGQVQHHLLHLARVGAKRGEGRRESQHQLDVASEHSIQQPLQALDQRVQVERHGLAPLAPCEGEQPVEGSTVIHSDQGTQFTSWTFTQRAVDSGLLPSMGSIGDCYDNAMIESFWSRMQVELLDRKRWKTRVGLANAIFEYLEIFHNRQRRHSALGMLTPIEYEMQHTSLAAA